MSQSSRERRSVTCSFSMLCGLILGLLCLEPAISSQIPCDSRTQFTCKILPICISLSRVRDGILDCPDGSDEECPFGMHRCACGVPRCIEKRLVADGIQHCMDGSDEGEDNSNFLCPDPPSRELLLAAKKNRKKRQTGFQDTPVVRRTGKITAFTGTEVNGDVTTLHTTRLHGTFTDGTYTQVYHTSSTILPTPAAYIRKDQDTDATPSFSVADQVQKFGSLSSGRVYRTAVNEPVSFSTSIPDIKITPRHSNEDFNVADDESRGLENAALSNEDDPIMEITGSLIPNMMDIVTRRLVLDVSAKTIGTQYPNEFGDSVISVTGTQGTFIHHDEAEDKTYPVFTGSYVRNSRQPTTYMFFFGDSPLTSDVKVIVPTKTFEAEPNTPHAEAYHAVESELKETRSGGFKNDHGQNAPHHIADINVNNILQPSISPADATPVYGILNTIKADEASLSPGRPIAITRYIQPTARILSRATVLTATNKIPGGRMRNPKTSTLRGHPDRYKYGRMYNPTTVAGRRVHGTAGATIITDQFFFPGHRRPQTSNVASASNYDYYDDENDNAFYEGDDIQLGAQDLGNEFRKVFEGQIAQSPSGGSFSDKRLTRTVGLYGPIYEADHETNQQGPSSQANRIHPTRSELAPSEGDQEMHSTDGKTVTLFGFAKFNTKISGTNYVFVPASSQPKTFTPRVTRTQGISEITDFLNKGSSTQEQNVFFRRPVFGTETREFISQTSMFTSTVKEPVEMQKTMFTSTVVAKQPGDERTRNAKLGETAETTIITASQSVRKHILPSDEYIISKEDSSTKNFMDFNNQMANENTKELDVTEIVDDIEEFEGLGVTPQPTGLVSSFTGSEVVNGMTTHWTTLIFGTYIDNTYAHIIESTSSIFFTVSKTASPHETLTELSESQDNPYSYEENSDSTTTFSVESKKVSLPRESDQILSSLNNVPLDKVSESVVYTESLSSIRPVEILTSGFFLPNQHSENYPTASSSSNEKIWKSTEDSEGHSISEKSLTDLEKIEAITPGVVYVDEDEDNTEVFTDSLDASTKSQDASTPTESLQILTDGFILPIGTGNREIISPVENPERSLSSEFLSLVAEKSSDVLINDRIMTPTESKSDPLEFIINNRKSDTHADTSVEDNNTVHRILDSPGTETSDQSTVLENTNAKTENTIDGHLTAATVLGNVEENESKQTKSPSDILSDAKPIITPAVVYAEDASSSMGETPSIVLLTGDFILPRHPSYDPEKSEHLEEINHDSHFSSILTNGFIFPDLSEESTKTEGPMDISIPSPLEHLSKSEKIQTSDYISRSENMSQIQSSLSILTSGFILPKQEVNNIEKKSNYDRPSSALLVENLTPADEDGEEIVESPIDSTPSGRNAGDSPKTVVSDDFILPTPTTPNKESNILNDSESSSHVDGDSVTNDNTDQFASESGTKSPNERMGKSMKFNYQTSHDRPDVEELLPSISYPITYYTTSTYFTTFLVDGRTVVSSRESTATQVYTDIDHLRQAQTKQPHPPYLAENQEEIKPSSSGGFSTFFTTFTHYKTFLSDGSKVVTSSEETKTQLVRKDEAIRVTLEPSYTVSTYPTTYYTTLTYFTTLLRDGSQEVITNQQIVSNVVTPSVDFTPLPVASVHGIKITNSESPIRQKPTTYYTTYTYYTTFLKEGTTSVNTRHETVSNVLHGTVTSDYNNINPTTTKKIENQISPTTSDIKPTTYFTTYTYYTTYLRGGNTVVSSREEVVSSISRKTSVLPLLTDKSTKDALTSSPLKTTFYTTYTYYTTLLKDGTTTVETRKETISDVRHGNPSVSATSVDHQFKPPLLSTPAPKVKTHFTTYTYFTTFLRDGSSVISSRESTVTNVFTESSPSVSTSKTASNIFPTRVFATYFTTLTSYFTLFSEGTPSISTVYNTLTDVVALSTPGSNNFPGSPNAQISKPKPITSTYTTVYTYFTTLLNQGTPVVSSREQTMTNVVILPTSKADNINKPTTIVHAVTTLTSLNKKSTDTTPFLEGNVLKPFYTTYTYFTTFFRDGSPSVSTRYDTITDYSLDKRPHSSISSTTASQGLIEASLEKDFHDPSSSLPNDAPHSNALPVTIYSTRTLDVTDSKDDTNSRIQIVSSLHESLDSSENGVPSQNGFEVKELYTTHTYFTTYFPHGFPVIESRIETVKNTPPSEMTVDILATKEKLGTDLDAAEGEFHENRVQPTISSTYNSTNNSQDANILEEINIQFSRKEVTASAGIEHEFNNSASAVNLFGTTPEAEHITTTIFPSTLECCSETNQLPTSTYRTVTLFITNYDKGSPVVITRIETLTAALDSLVSNIAHTISNKEEVPSSSVSVLVNANVEEYQPARPRKAYENVTEEYSVTKQYSNKSTSDVSLSNRLLNSSIPLQVSNEDKIPTVVTTETPETSAKPTEKITAKEGSTSVLEKAVNSSLPINDNTNASKAERVPAVDMATEHSVAKATTNPPSVTPNEEKGSDSEVTAQSQGSPMETTLLTKTTQIPNLSEITSEVEASTKIGLPISTTTETSNKTEILTTTEITTTTEVPTTTEILRRSIFSRRRNRPSYRPNTLTRSPKITLSSTTSTTTTTTTKSPTAFTRRNSSRLLFRRPTVANRTFPIRRLRTSQLPPVKENSSSPDENVPSSSRRKRSFFSPTHFEEMPKLRKLLNTRDEDTAIKNNDLIYSDTKVNNGEVAVRSGGDEHHISPRQNSKDVQPTGLLRSLEARAVANGVTTIYATEIYGTFINGAYAQIVHSATRVLSDTPNEIFRTSMNLSPSHLGTSAISHEPIKEANSQKVGLVSSIINTSVREGTTTLHKTNIYGTYVGSVYAHIAQTTASIISPTPVSQNAYPTGLISSSIRSQIEDDKTVVWTTQIYGTFVNGYYAHVASTSSRVLSPQSSSRSHNSKEMDHKIGLLSSLVSDQIVNGITTQYTTNIFGTFIGEYYAQHAVTSSRILTPSSTTVMNRSVGLVSTILNSVVNENTATLFKTEVYGTYIGQHYAQIAKTSTEIKILPSKQSQSVVSQTPSQKTGLITSSILRSEVNHDVTTLHMNEIYGTYIGNAYAHVARSTSRVIYPTETTTSHQEETTSQKTGLISSRVRTEVNEGTTTLHIAEIHGTYIGNYYAHVAKRTSTVLPFAFIAPTPTPPPPTTNSNLEGLVSSQLNTEINDGTTTLHTREIYGTSINGYYAHIARSTSNIIKPTVSTKVDAPTTGLLSSITSSEFNNGMLTLHTTEIYGTRINGFYAHIARSTSNVIADPFLQTFGILSSVLMEPSSSTANWLKVENGIPKTEVTGRHVDNHNQGSSIAYELDSYSAMITNAFVPVEARQTLLPITARDDLDTARVNHVDRDNHDHFPTTKGLYSSTFIDHVSALKILSPSFNSDNVLEAREKQMSTPVLLFDKHTTKIADIQDSSSYFKPALSNTLVPDSHYKRQDQVTPSQEKSIITVTPTQLENQRQKLEKSDSKDYNYDFDDDSSLNGKESGIKSHSSSSENYKSRAKSRPPENTDENESENDYDEYDFEGDYDDYNGRKEHEKTSSVLTSSLYGATRVSFTNANQQSPNGRDKTSVYNEKQYDDYEDEFDDSEVSDESFSKSKEAQSTKDLPSTSVRIRPFVGRGRPTYSTPARTTTKPTFTIQFRRPSRVRNSRANSQRSDNENNDEFDDDLRNEEDEGDIEASEAVVTSATPQVLPFKRKPFGNQRYQPLTRTQPGSTTTSRPVNINRSRRIFGRSSTNPSPTPSLKDHVSDYEENTTEDDDFDNFDDINDKEDNGGVNRGSRSTRRPSSIFPRASDRRNGSSKRGSQRHREDEEVENDDFDSTTPDYRNSRNRLQRKPNRNRYNRNRSPSLKASPNSVSRDEDEDSQSLQPINRPRVNNNRRRQSYNPRTRRPTKTATETKSTVNKPHLTITSVVTTVKTLPIYHGFRTSFATLTTTALDTSIIRPSQYSTVVTDGITKTLFFSKVGIPDGLENFHTTITEVVVTTTSLASIKLVPIKIGFSTRTDTVTDIQVLTTLSTVYSTISPDTPIPTAFPQQFQPPFFPQIGPPNPDFGLLTSANSFITTHIVTSTTVIPIVSRGRTILSTLTTTSIAESIVIQTATIRVPQVPSPAPFIPQPYFAFQPITTLLTLYVTGEYGELKPVVTTVTVPVYQQPVFHTKVARSLQSAASDHQIDSTKHPDLVFRTSTSGEMIKNAVEIDTHYDKLLSSGLEEIDDMSEMSSTYSPTEPLGATIISSSIGDHFPQDTTTISKGPLIEIYEQKATVHLDGNSRDLTENEIESISSQSINKYGIESSYNFRKLQQFTVDEPVDFRPQRDFTRIRRIPQGVIRESAIDPRIRDSSLVANDRGRLQPQIRPLERYPDFEAFTGGDSRGPEQNVRQPLRGRVREGSTYQRLPPRLNTSFRPFIEVPRRPDFSSNVAKEETLPSPGAQVSSQPLSDLRQLGGLLDSLRNANDELDDPNNFPGSPLLNEKEGFKALTALDSHSSETQDVTPTKILRVVRPNGGAAVLSSNNGRRIIRTRIISPTASVSSPEEENELTSKISEKSENVITLPFLRSATPSVNADAFHSVSSHSNLAESTLNYSLDEESNENEDNDHGDSSGFRRTIVRRLKSSLILGDGSGSRRPVIVRRTRVNSATTDTRNTAIGLTSVDPVVKEKPSDISESTNSDNPSIDSDDSSPSPDDDDDENANNPSTNDRKPLKKIIRLRKPEMNSPAQNGQRRRVVVTRRPQDITESRSFQGRGPAVTSVLHDEEQKNNLIVNNLNILKKEDQDLDDFNKIGNIQGRETNTPRSVQNTYSTVRFPLTYFTTLTYYTTFVRGTDIAYASREAVFSNVLTQTLDPNLISVIRNDGGILSSKNENRIMHLASRTLGDTTTLVNLASRQSVYNSDVDYLLKYDPDFKTLNPVPTRSIVSLTSTLSLTQLVKSNTLNINAIASLPKTYVTLFTYIYTFYDGVERRESTRAETMTNVATDPAQFSTESIGSSIDGFGYLPIEPETRTVHLGSRRVEGTATEVNLGLKTIIHFSGLRNVVLERNQPFQYITPSRTVLPKTETPSTDEIIRPSFEPSQETTLTPLQPSYVSANELFGSDRNVENTKSTPLIPSESTEKITEIDKHHEKVLKVTSVIHKSSGLLRSGVFTPRPGVRVRVRPAGTKREEQDGPVSSVHYQGLNEHPLDTIDTETFDPPTSDVVDLVIPTPVIDSSYITSDADASSLHDDATAGGHENEVISEDYDATLDGSKPSEGVTYPRKRLKITVRRPQSGSVSRTHTRFVLPSRFEITSRPRFYVVTRTGALGVVSPTQQPFTVKISRKVKPTQAEGEDIAESTTIVYDTFTTLTSVPVIFGLDTSFRNVLLTTSSAVTVSEVSPTFELETPALLPSHSVVLTYFTTTTFTIPYVVGDQTIFTTMEETNSRVVIQTFDGLDSITYSTITRPTVLTEETTIPTLSSMSNVEYGIDGFTTHFIPSESATYSLESISAVPSSLDSITFISPLESTTVLYDTQTFFTTYTFFTTFFTDTDSFVSSYEQVVSNVITVPVTMSVTPTVTPEQISDYSSPTEPLTLFDTSEHVTTSTSYKTVTFYATLFNDTMSFVTPIEEVQTEVVPITETYTITRTVLPTLSLTTSFPSVESTTEEEQSVVVTQTLYTTYTNFVTLFQGSDSMVSSIEEVVTNVVTVTVAPEVASSLSVLATPTLSDTIIEATTTTVTPETSQSPIYTTREILSTQTHYLTLFNGDEQLLSSIEEVITSHVTELVPTDLPSVIPQVISTSSIELETETYTTFAPRFTTEEEKTETTEEIQTYQPELVPSIRTIYSTLTFYTTYYSDTSSIVASQEEILTSYVTLFVPPSLITSTESSETMTSSSSISTPIEPIFVFTTTDYSTLTLYTTLFSGDETLVISSEQVVPEVITATITPSSTTTTQLSPSAESVLTFLTTFTYYTTYFSGNDAVIASSESVVTQFVTIEAGPTSISSSSIIDTSLTTSSVDETILGISTNIGGNIHSSFKDDLRDTEAPSIETVISSSIAEETEPVIIGETSVVSKIDTKVHVESKIETRVHVESTAVFETEKSYAVTPSFMNTSTPTSKPDTISSSEERSPEGRGIRLEESRSYLPDITDIPTIISDSEGSLPYAVTTLSTSETPALPITSSSTVTESTEIIGLDGEITTLTPGSTLLLVTGIDGFVTRLSDNDVTSSVSSEIIPTANTSQSSSDIKPASVIELSDLLAGNTAFGGDIGLAIQDIVSLITGKKNKTDGKAGPVETTLQDTTVTQTEKTTVQDKGELDSTAQTETTTDSSQPTTAEKDSQEDEHVVTTPKDQDYPVFVATSNSSEANQKRRPLDALTPVYIASSSESTSSKVSSSDLSKSTPSSEIHVLSVQESPALVSTSVVTGARTVFILPTSMTGKESPEDAHTSKITIESVSTVSPTSISSVTTSSVGPSTTLAENRKVTEAIPSIDNSKLGVSVVSGVRTVFFGTTSSKTESRSSTSLSPSAIEITTGILSTKANTLKDISNVGRANTEQEHPKSFSTFTIDGQTVISRTTTGATTIFFPAQIPKVTPSTLKTRYVTSVESITRTLALTTTRTYHTRDSTLTVPSVYTTTIPPRTFVSTIIGTRTILGILPEPTETIQIHQTSAPSERTTTVTTTTLIFNSIPSTVVRTLVLPTRLASQSTESTSSLNESTTESNVFSAGTERPAKPPEVADSTFVAVDKANEDAEVIKTNKIPVQRPRDETYLRAAGPRLRDYQYDVRAESETVRPPIVIKDEGFPSENSVDVSVCSSPCQAFKKEICKESNGLWSCQCRPGHARKDRHEICKEIQTYVVLLKILKRGNSSVEFNKGLADINSNEFKEFEKVAKEGISEVYQYTNIRDHYLDAEVNEIVPVMSDISNSDQVDQSYPVGVVVNFTVQVSPDVSGNLLEQELTRTLLSDDPRVAESLLLIAPLSQSVHDFDECTDSGYNDCSSKAVCENFPGSYSCRCKDEFEDMNSKLPGRECLAKTVNCEYCHGRGDCLENMNAKIFCRCLPMYIGRRCEINGLVLAIALPTAVAIVVLLLCTVLCCCRRCRKKSTPKSDPSGMFRGIALRGPVGGTLDRKAMIDTSSESSGEHGRRNSQPFEGYQESGDVTPKKGSKRSDLSLDRSLSTGYTVPPVMIPRARQQQQNNPNKLNYTLYNGQVYVW